MQVLNNRLADVEDAVVANNDIIAVGLEEIADGDAVYDALEADVKSAQQHVGAQGSKEMESVRLSMLCDDEEEESSSSDDEECIITADNNCCGAGVVSPRRTTAAAAAGDSSSSIINRSSCSSSSSNGGGGGGGSKQQQQQQQQVQQQQQHICSFDGCLFSASTIRGLNIHKSTLMHK